LLLRGDAGIGKTVLWEHLVASARAGGYTVLASHPAASETRLSYAALGDLVSNVPGAALEALPAPQRTALDIALLRAGGARTEQLAVSMAFVSLLAWAARSAPVVVAVDDAQWIDAPTARVLEFALRRTTGHDVRFVLAVRSGEPAPLGDALLREISEPGTLILQLGQLSLGALHHLFSSRLGQHFPRPTLVKLAQASEGNPLLALEIARALVESGESIAPGAPLPVPRSLRQLLNRRIVRLPQATRGALLVVAGSADPDAATVARALGIDDAAALLEPAEIAGVVEHDRGRLRFGHPLMASVVYGAASPAQLRDLHGRLAAVATSDEERARHLALSTQTADETIAATLEQAASSASQRGAPDATAELMALARTLTPIADTASRTRRLLAAAEAMFEAGDSMGGRRLLEGAAAEMPRDRDRARVLLLLATIRWYDDVVAAFTLGEEALVDAADDPTLRGRIHTRLALFSPDQEQAAAHSDAAVRLIDPDEDPSLLAFALFGSFYEQIQSGKAIRMDMFERALSIEPERPTWEVSTIPALWWKYTDDYPRSRERLHQHLGWARESGDASSDADTLAHLAELELWAGDWRLAEEYATASVDAAEQMGQPLENPSHRVQALVLAHLGRTTQARAAAAAGLAATSDDPTLAAMYHTVLGFAALTDDDPAAADQSFSALEGQIAELGILEAIRFRWEPDHIEALVALGDADRAEALVARLETRHAFLPRPWTAVVTLRSRALMRAARGDVEGGIGEVAAAVLASASLASPFEAARTLLVQGQILRRANQRRAAAAALDEAQRIFESLPAPAWALRVRDEAARLGLRRDAGSALTPSEREVALLAAQGLTNREVAERLFVSPKTVEANLSRAYSKLGIRSRAELGRVMADTPAVDGAPPATDS
jgi:DNA-binding NarL/FixJ family response regulator